MYNESTKEKATKGSNLKLWRLKKMDKYGKIDSIPLRHTERPWGKKRLTEHYFSVKKWQSSSVIITGSRYNLTPGTAVTTTLIADCRT